MKDTLINWANDTWNPWVGCTRVSPECLNCFAEWQQRHRLRRVGWGRGQPRRRTSPAYWRQPHAWNRECEKTGVRRRVFCASLSDFFDDEVDDSWRNEAFDEVIEPCRGLDWLLLTKRPEVALRFSARIAKLPHVWLGVSAGDQLRADQRLPILAQIPAAIRWVSAEPLLGPINLEAHITNIDWLIAGGESGSRFRPMDLDWPRGLRDQCVAAGVPYWFKQFSGVRPHGLGRALDGREWSELPTPRTRPIPSA